MTTNKKNQNYKNFIFSKTFTDTILTIIVFIIIFIIILNPKVFNSGTVSGLKLFFFNVLPGLFPFMLLTKLLTEIGLIFKICKKLDKFSYKLFGTPGVSIYALLMSILSGYPIGAKIIADLYSKKQITEFEAKKMSLFCTTSGPIFIIGTIGVTMFKNYKFGLILYISHILSSILLGIIYHILTKNKNQNTSKIVIIQKQLNPARQINIVSKCINETINSLFVVGAYITIFYLIGELFEILNIFKIFNKLLINPFNFLGFNSNQTSGFVYGILEVTRGSKLLSMVPEKSSLIIATGIVSFSGISIIMQSMTFLKEAKIKAHNFVFSKCVHCVLSMFLCCLFVVFI
jgi:sporulation integral membrane protein YlbJ